MIKLGYNNRERIIHTVSPRLNGMKAAQNLDFLSKYLPIVFDTSTKQRSNYPPCVQHMALGV